MVNSVSTPPAPFYRDRCGASTQLIPEVYEAFTQKLPITVPLNAISSYLNPTNNKLSHASGPTLSADSISSYLSSPNDKIPREINYNKGQDTPNPRQCQRNDRHARCHIPMWEECVGLPNQLGTFYS